MRKIEFLEKVRHRGDEFQKGQVLEHEEADYFIKLGWAKCCETGEMGERRVGVSKIKPEKIIQENS